MDLVLSPLSGRLLLWGWCSQLLLAAVVALVAPIPQRPLLIERRYCSQQEWSAMLQRYQDLVRRDRLGIEHFRPVIQYGVLAEQRSEGLPPAATLALDSAVGGGDAPRGASLRDRYPTAMVLSCRPGN